MKTTITTTTTTSESKIVEEGDYPDCDCGDLLRRKSAQAAAAVVAL